MARLGGLAALMATRGLLTGSVMILLWVLAAALVFPAPAAAQPYKVVKVYDGDTIRVENDGTEIKIRLAGIDAPEMGLRPGEKGQPFAAEARDFLEGLILDEYVMLEEKGFAGHDLYLATVILGEEDINRAMVEIGLAEVDCEELPDNIDFRPLLVAQDTAQADKLGMWAQGEDYVSPRAWRGKDDGRSAAAMVLFSICGQQRK